MKANSVDDIIRHLNMHERFDITNSPTYGMIFDKLKFKTPNVHSFNHNGHNIDAVFETAYEEDERGYLSHRLSLIHKETPVGYIKVFYMPKETFDTLYPDILHWLDSCKGHSFGLGTHDKNRDLSDDDNYWNKKTIEQKKDTLLQIALNLNYNIYSNLNKKFDNNENVNLEKEYESFLKLANKKYKDEFNKFKQQNIDKPIIDFSKIKEKQQKMNQLHWSTEIKNYCKNKNINFELLPEVKSDDISFIRTGLGQKMYLLMSDWLGLNNLPLCKGGTNDMSEPLWECKLKNNSSFNVVEDATGTYIDHRTKNCSYLMKKSRKITI